MELAGLVADPGSTGTRSPETGEIQEPLLLIAKLSANPELAMSLMTESEPGVEFEMELSDTLEEAAAQILEEIMASIKGVTLAPLQ